MSRVLRISRQAALLGISVLVTAASLTSFAESYRGLYLWAAGHGLHGVWAAGFPLQCDVFIAVGELALVVALVDSWPPRSRLAAWVVTGLGLAVSVAGNVGHVAGHSLASRGTAAVPPLAAAAALAVGLGVLKRVVAAHHDAAPTAQPAEVLPAVAGSSEEAARAAYIASVAASNPISQRQLMTRFGLTRAQATRVRQSVAAEANGQPSRLPAPDGQQPAR